MANLFKLLDKPLMVGDAMLLGGVAGFVYSVGRPMPTGPFPSARFRALLWHSSFR